MQLIELKSIVRVGGKAERKRGKPTKEEKERELKRETERVQNRDQILAQKLQEVLPALRKRSVSRRNGLLDTSSSAGADIWVIPPGSSIDISNHRVILAPVGQETSRNLRAAHWHNEAGQWVKFVFALDEAELVFFEETRTKAPRMICQSHPGRIKDGVSAVTMILWERLTVLAIHLLRQETP